MAGMAALGNRLRTWGRFVFRRRQLATEMEEEMRFHMESRTEDLIRSGYSVAEARRQARLEFGSTAAPVDGMLASFGFRWSDELMADVRYGLRLLRKSPGFTAMAVASLALAIGANTTIFSVAKQMLYQRLGVPRAQELRMLYHEDDDHSVIHSSWGDWEDGDNGRSRSNSFPYPVYQLLRQGNQSLGEIVAFKDLGQVNATIDGTAQPVRAEMVSGNFYPQMRTLPVMGRGLLPADDGAPGTGAVTVLSYGFWQRAFGGSPAVVGKVFRVDMNPVTIVGVNAREFTGVEAVTTSPDLFLPMSFLGTLRPVMGTDVLLSSPSLAWVNLIAREKPGVAMNVAQAGLDGVFQSAIRSTMTVKPEDSMPRLVVSDGSRGQRMDARRYARPIYVLMGLAGCVLLLACANVANLMLARAAARQREISVRLALGARRSRIFRQVLTESLLLAGLGGVGGTLLGYMARNMLPRLLQNSWERSDANVPFDWRIYGFSMGITLLTGLFFGIAPAWRATRANVSTALKEGSRTATRGSRFWSGKAIVAFQLALSTLLVTGSALFLRTVWKLNSVDPGFKVAGLTMFQIIPPNNKYPGVKSIALHEQLEQRLAAVPGVDGVAASEVPLLAQYSSNTDFNVEGTHFTNREDTTAFYDAVGPEFFKVMQIPLLAGRGFSTQDTAATPEVAVINQSLARKFFAGKNPIGQRFSSHERKIGGKYVKQWTEIVGVCADTSYADLRRPPIPLFFSDFRQFHEDVKQGLPIHYMIRSRVKAGDLVASLQRAVQTVDPDLPLIDVRTQQQQINATMRQERIFASLTAGFGLLALLLASVGVYGVMAYTVSQRTNEIGIRLALGAARGRVRGMILGDASWLAVGGVLAGSGVALLMVRLVKSFLFGVEPYDPVSMLGAAMLLLLVALVATWVPAVRASRIDPMRAIRHD